MSGLQTYLLGLFTPLIAVVVGYAVWRVWCVATWPLRWKYTIYRFAGDADDVARSLRFMAQAGRSHYRHLGRGWYFIWGDGWRWWWTRS